MISINKLPENRDLFSYCVDVASLELIGNFRSENEYDYEYEFSVLSKRTLKNVDLET